MSNSVGKIARDRRQSRPKERKIWKGKMVPPPDRSKDERKDVRKYWVMVGVKQMKPQRGPGPSFSPSQFHFQSFLLKAFGFSTLNVSQRDLLLHIPTLSVDRYSSKQSFWLMVPKMLHVELWSPFQMHIWALSPSSNPWTWSCKSLCALISVEPSDLPCFTLFHCPSPRKPQPHSHYLYSA